MQPLTHKEIHLRNCDRLVLVDERDFERLSAVNWHGQKQGDNTTQQAVAETAGQILSYQGGVVESLYGATQAIVDRAHKGVGMSQSGAYAYAAQGYDYRQILETYYPGVEIARLESKR